MNEYFHSLHAGWSILIILHTFDDIFGLKTPKTVHTANLLPLLTSCPAQGFDMFSQLELKYQKIPGLKRSGQLQQVAVHVRIPFTFITHIGSMSVCVNSSRTWLLFSRGARQET